MGGFEDHVTITGDWMPPSPNPRSFFSSMLCDEVVAGSNAEPSFENKSDTFVSRFEGPASGSNDEPTKASVEGDGTVNPIMPPKPQVCSRGKLVERMAARAGFNAPRLNTKSIGPPELPKNSDAQSHFLMTIPAGLSPTTLLDSPVFLNNSLVLPSPTTGKFSFAPGGNNRNSAVVLDDSDQGKKNASKDNSSFAFKPNAESGYIPHIDTANKVNASELAPWSFHGGVSVHSDASYLHQNVEPPTVESQVYVESYVDKDERSNHGLEMADYSVAISENSPPLDEPNGDDGDQSGGDPIGSPSDDGYNWRKYGQKQVRGSEYPRSYYKCTHPNCPVKKKVERSQDGHITEIIYKGAHNHPKPPPTNHRPSIGSSAALTDIHQLESGIAARGVNGNTVWSAMQKGNGTSSCQWSHDNPDATSSEQIHQEYSSGGPSRPQNGSHCELGDGGVDGSCTFSNDEDEDGRAAHVSVSLGCCEGGGDESESKRRRIETYAPEMAGGATRAIREQRVVVQTASEVDILDDGYRWRKYGQKVVKGNPNPRSYYKCTSAGCNVRKHVERASHDLKSVLTTYEGKHNHDVPAARNSSHVNSGGSNTHLNQQSPHLTVSGHINRPEPSQLHNSTARFGRAGPGAFGLPGRPQMGPGPGHGFGLNQPVMTNLGLTGLGHIQGKFPVHPYFGHQPLPMNDVSFMMPKTEPKLEPMTDPSGLHSYDGNSLYQQFMMNRLPLGP